MLVAVPEDKDSSMVIMKRADYIAKMQVVIGDGITCDFYLPTTYNTINDLKTFRDFLSCNFKGHKKYEKMLPTSV